MLRKKGYEWTDAPHFSSDVSTSDSRILSALVSLSNNLKMTFGRNIQEMTERAQARNISDYTAFKTIAEEVMSNGIQWSHVVTLLVFSSELAFLEGVRDHDVDFISRITEWVTRYFCQSDSLKSWIEHQSGGWDGISHYARLAESKISSSSSVVSKMTIFAGLSAAAAGLAYFITKSTDLL